MILVPLFGDKVVRSLSSVWYHVIRGCFTGTPISQVRIVVAKPKYYNSLYEDLSDRHLGVKKS